MKKQVLALLGAVALASFATGASAQSVVSGTITNTTTVSVNLSSPTCQGVLTPSTGSIPSGGGTLGYSATSGTSTSNGCTIRVTRSDNLRFCNWVLNRLRSSLTGPWNFPTINSSGSSSTGVTCTSSISNVNTNGNWTANLTIAP